MNTAKILSFVILFFTITINAQKKIKVSEDAFVQGGDTKNTTFGVEKSNALMVANSKKSGKYSRNSYLKFEITEDIKDKKIILHIPVKVFNKSGDESTLFNLEVYTVEDNTWSENEITFENKPSLGKKIGGIEIPESVDKKMSWQKIELDTKEVSALLNQSKSTTLSLALVNLEFNKTSAMMGAKEKSKKFSSYITIE